MDGREEKGRVKTKTITYEVLCLFLFFFSFLFFPFSLNIEKTSFGLNLKEAESGMVVALAGNSLERETSTCNGAMPPPAWSHESSIIRIARVSATTREDCLSCPVSGAKYGKGSGGDSQLCPSHSCWDKGGMVDGHIRVVHPGTDFLVILKIGREKRDIPFLPAIDHNRAQEPGNETASPAGREEKGSVTDGVERPLVIEQQPAGFS